MNARPRKHKLLWACLLTVLSFDVSCSKPQKEPGESPDDPDRIIAAGGNPASWNTRRPIAGDNGLITVDAVTDMTVTLRWTLGWDDRTDASELVYQLYSSTKEGINGVAETIANGTPNGAPQNGIDAIIATGLPYNTTHYFNVIIADEAGNQEIYNEVSATTKPDTTPPVPPVEAPAYSFLGNTYVTISWTEATDPFTDRSLLKYRPYYSRSNNIGTLKDLQKNGVSQHEMTKGTTSAAFANLNIGTDYYFNVLVEDPAGNQAVFNPIKVKTYDNPVARYEIFTTDPTTITAGESINFEIVAKDVNNRVVTGLDNFLRSFTFSWSGAGISPAPSSKSPEYSTTLNFVDGRAFTSVKFFKAETIAKATLKITDSGNPNVSGVYATSALSVLAAPAAAINITASTNQIAGTAFSVPFIATDVYSNPTDVGCDAVATISGGSVSPGGHEGVATTPIVPTTLTRNSLGRYSFNGMTLYKENVENVLVSACGVASQDVDITVAEAAPHSIYFSLTDVAPASGIAAPGLTELKCANSGAATAASVSCQAVYAFFWDAYGNQVGDPASSCSWSFVSIASAPLPVPAVSANSHSLAVTSNDYIDGYLRCTKGATTSQLNLYGGTSRLSFANDYPAPGPIEAGLDNINISQLQLYYRHNGVEEQKDDAGTETVALAVTSSLGIVGVGQQATRSCVFDGTGRCPDTFGFDFTLHESVLSPSLNAGNHSITMTVRGKSASLSSINIIPTDADHVKAATISAKRAGDPFNLTAAIYDRFENITNKNCVAATLDVTGGSASPGGHGGAVTAPSYSSAVSMDTYGHFTYGPMTLFNEQTESLVFTVTGCTPAMATSNSDTKSVVVNNGAANVVVLTTTNSAPADTSSIAEIQCSGSGAATSANVTCAPVYAFFWDAYGNAVADPTSACDSWSYLTIGGAPAPAVSGSTHSYSLGHNNYIDGSLICTKDSRSAAVAVYGGVSRIAVTHNYTSPGPIEAALDNISVSKIQTYLQHGGVEETKNDAGTETITISTTSLSGVAGIGQTATQTCIFNGAGACLSTILFDMTLHESSIAPILNSGNKQITLTVRGKSDSITGINVVPSDPDYVYTYPVTSKTAGVGFQTAAAIKDRFNNITAKNCASATLATTGGTSSPGGHGGVVTAPQLPASVGFDSYGHFTTGTMVLYHAAVNSMTHTVSGCSPGIATSSTNSFNITVNSGPANIVVLRNADVLPADTSSDSEINCANSGLATSSATTCNPIYSFFWDAYGNPLTGHSCGAWSFTTIGGAPSPTVSGAGHSFAVTNSNYLDGNLKCTKDGKSQQLLAWGGVSRIKLTDNYPEPGPIPAANDNIAISQIELFSRRNGTEVAKTYATTTAETITFGTDSTVISSGQPASTTCDFTTNGICSSVYSFDMTKHESNLPAASVYANGLGNRSITATIRGKSASITAINITPAAASSLSISPISVQVAGSAFSVNVSVYDQFANLTDGASSAKDCTDTAGRLTVTGATASPGGHGGIASSPILPAGIAQTSLGLFGAGNITLYKKGTETLSFEACGLTATTTSVTVTESDVATIFLNDSDLPPSSNLASTTCTSGSTIVCPTLYAFAWDHYGNDIDTGAIDCSAWSYLNNNTGPFLSPAPTLTNSSGHSTQVSSSAWHLNGTIRCAVGGIMAATAVGPTKIDKAYNWSCGNWTCSAAGSPAAACTIHNATGYGIGSLSIGGNNVETSLVTTACDSGLATGNNCSIQVLGTTGYASGSLTVNGAVAAAHAGFVNINDPASAVVNAGSVAPRCSNVLTEAVGSWSCLNGEAIVDIALTNENEIESAIVSSSNPSLTPVNGYVWVSQNCKGATLLPGEYCTDRLKNPDSGKSTTINYTMTDSFFQNKSVILGNSPSCVKVGAISSTVTAVCSGSPAAKSLRYTITNNNSLEDMVLPPSAVVLADGGILSADTCDSAVVAKSGGTCSFEVTYDPAPVVNNTSIQVIESGSYFDDIFLGPSDGDNSCL